VRTAALIALSWLLAGIVAPAAAQQQAPDLSAQALRFTVANAEFTLMHEMGHLLISELGLPVLGREEDAADQLGFMGLFLLHGRQHDATFYAKLMDVADYWRLEWRNAERNGDGIALWDSHALDAQRFYTLACLAYGSDPQRMEWIIQATDLPEERAFYCDQEYAQALHAVNWLKEHFRRKPGEPAGARIQVHYDPPSYALEEGQQLLERVRASGELEAVANKAADTFALPRPLILRLTSCGAADAWYDQRAGELTLCYEQLEHLRHLAAQLPHLRNATGQGQAQPAQGGRQ
jgi:hypothetical protein